MWKGFHNPDQESGVSYYVTATFMLIKYKIHY